MGQTQPGRADLLSRVPGVLIVKDGPTYADKSSSLHFHNTDTYEVFRETNWSQPIRRLADGIVTVGYDTLRLYDVAANRFLATIPRQEYGFSWFRSRCIALSAHISNEGAFVEKCQLHPNNWGHVQAETISFEYNETEDEAKARRGRKSDLSIAASQLAGTMMTCKVGGRNVNIEIDQVVQEPPPLSRLPVDPHYSPSDALNPHTVPSSPFSRHLVRSYYNKNLLLYSSGTKVALFDTRKSSEVLHMIQTACRFGTIVQEIDGGRFAVGSRICNWNGRLACEHGIVQFYSFETGKLLHETPLTCTRMDYLPPYHDHTLSSSGIIGRTEKYFVPSEKVTRGKFLGQGAQGRVYRGTFQISAISSLDVAIKRFLVKRYVSPLRRRRQQQLSNFVRQDQNDEEEEEEGEDNRVLHHGICSVEELEHEIAIMIELDHVNILKCHGCFFDEDEIDPDVPTVNVILEWCSGGDLNQFLRRNFRFISEICPPERKVDFVLQIARGLDHMHQRGIVHSDLGLENVLVTSHLYDGEKQYVMKLCDFGLSNRTGSVKSMVDAGKPRYMPPDRSGSDKTKIDIYSLGILAWEIWNHGRHAYTDELLGVVGAMNRLMRIRAAGLRPNLGECEGMTGRMKALLSSCWAEDPDERPSAEEVVAELEEILLNPFEEEEEGEDEHNDKKKRSVENWTVEEVGNHFGTLLSDEDIKKVFVFNLIAGKDLGDLGMQKLRRMGIDNCQTRITIATEIDSLLDLEEQE